MEKPRCEARFFQFYTLNLFLDGLDDLDNLEVLEILEFLVFQKEAFCFNGSLAACACSTDSLTIDGIGTVAGNEDACELCARSTVNLLQIPYLICFEPLLKDVSIGFVTNSQEETVNLDIYQLFVGLTLALYEMSTFDTILAKETQRVVFEEYLDVLAVHHALLHDLGGTQEGLADNHIHLLGQSAEIERILAGRIAATNDGNRLLAIEETVARSTGTDALTIVFALVVKTQILGRGSCGNDDGIGLQFATSVVPGFIGTLRKIDANDFTVADVGTKTLSLFAQVHHHLIAVDTLRIAREVFDLSSLGQLSARLQATILNRTQIGPGSINGSGIPCGSAAYNQTFYMVHIL